MKTLTSSSSSLAWRAVRFVTSRNSRRLRARQPFLRMYQPRTARTTAPQMQMETTRLGDTLMSHAGSAHATQRPATESNM